MRPSTQNAAGVARRVSRLLKEAGFQKFDAKYSPYGYDKDSEGFSVSRAGYLPLVTIHWSSTNQYHSEATLAFKRQKERQMKHYLESKGYTFTTEGIIGIQCEESGAL
jgi:hypothetical protein